MALCYSRLLATILFVGVGVGLVAYIAMYVIVGDGGKTRIMTWLRNGTPLDEVDMMSTRPVAWTNHSQPAGGAVLITSLIRQTTNVTTTRHSEPHTGLGAQNATRHTGPRAEHEAGANTSRDNLDVTNDVFLGRFARICENVAIPKDIELNGRPLCPCIPQRLRECTAIHPIKTTPYTQLPLHLHPRATPYTSVASRGGGAGGQGGGG